MVKRYMHNNQMERQKMKFLEGNFKLYGLSKQPKKDYNYLNQLHRKMLNEWSLQKKQYEQLRKNNIIKINHLRDIEKKNKKNLEYYNNQKKQKELLELKYLNAFYSNNKANSRQTKTNIKFLLPQLSNKEYKKMIKEQSNIARYNILQQNQNKVDRIKHKFKIN